MNKTILTVYIFASIVFLSIFLAPPFYHHSVNSDNIPNTNIGISSESGVFLVCIFCITYGLGYVAKKNYTRSRWAEILAKVVICFFHLAFLALAAYDFFFVKYFKINADQSEYNGQGVGILCIGWLCVRFYLFAK